MIDYKTLHPAVQAIVELALTSNTQAIAASGSPRFRELADKACDLFEQYSMEDQVGGLCAPAGDDLGHDGAGAHRLRGGE